MSKTPKWSFNINFGFTRRASQLSVTEFGVFWLMRFSEEDLPEVFQYWEEESRPWTEAVARYEDYLDVVVRRITVASATVIQCFWQNVLTKTKNII
jgi:hypothetical protein